MTDTTTDSPAPPDLRDQMSDSGRSLSPESLVERSQIPLADPPNFTYLLREGVSTGVPGRFLPKILCGCYIGAFHHVWLGSDSGHVSIWQTDTRRQVVRFRPHQDAITSMASVGSESVAILSKDGELSLWTAATWTLQARVKIFAPSDNHNLSLTASPPASPSAGSSSASSSSSSSSAVPSSPTATPGRRNTDAATKNIQPQRAPAVILAGDEFIISGLPDTSIVRVQAAPPFALLRPIVLPADMEVSSMLWIGDRNELWLGTHSGTLVALPFSSDPSLPDNFADHCLAAHSARITALCLVSDRVWSTSVDTHIHAWDTATRTKYWTFYGHSTPVHTLCPIVSEVASTDGAGQLILWPQQPQEQQPKQPHSRMHLVCPNIAASKFANHEGPISGLLLLDDRSIWAYGWDGTVTVWERSPRDLRALLSHTESLDSTASPQPRLRAPPSPRVASAPLLSDRLSSPASSASPSTATPPPTSSSSSSSTSSPSSKSSRKSKSSSSKSGEKSSKSGKHKSSKSGSSSSSSSTSHRRSRSPKPPADE